MKQVIRIPEDKWVSVAEIYYKLPVEKIKPDRNGRKRPQRTRLVSHNGRHTICRDIGLTFGEPYWDMLLVEKVICSEFENKIYLRKKKKIEKHPVFREISDALAHLGYPNGTKVDFFLVMKDPILLQVSEDQALHEDYILVRPEGETELRTYNIKKHTFVD